MKIITKILLVLAGTASFLLPQLGMATKSCTGPSITFVNHTRYKAAAVFESKSHHFFQDTNGYIKPAGAKAPLLICVKAKRMYIETVQLQLNDKKDLSRPLVCEYNLENLVITSGNLKATATYNKNQSSYQLKIAVNDGQVQTYSVSSSCTQEI